MKVLVASTYVPFIDGGGRMIVRDLVAALRERDHQVDTIEIPFQSIWDRMFEQMLALRLLDVSDACETLIAIRTPAYMLRHPNKRLWFIHHHRGAYDLWGTPWQDIPSTPEGEGARRAIIAADELYLPEAQRIFTNSQIVADRLSKYNGIDASVLYPPLGNPERFVPGIAEDFVFYPCRITSHKRQVLAIEAAAELSTDARLIVAGAADHPAQLEPLLETIAARGLQDRVTLIPRWISEEEKADMISRSMGVLYIPFLEDSYGYVSLEAFQAHKPVITCTDSGGTLEIIRDGVNGRIADPDPRSLAGVIDDLRRDPAAAAAMGRRGYDTLAEHGIEWDRVVESLLS